MEVSDPDTLARAAGFVETIGRAKETFDALLNDPKGFVEQQGKAAFDSLGVTLNQAAKLGEQGKVFWAAFRAGDNSIVASIVAAPFAAAGVSRLGGVRGANTFTSKLSSDAAEIISNSTANQLRRQVALSQAKVDGWESLTSRQFTNLPGSVRGFPGTRQVNDDFFVIDNKEAFINKVEDLYGGDNNVLNPTIRERILEHVGDGSRLFPTPAGIPGLHAEVQAVNSILNQLPKDINLNNTRIDVSTIKLKPGPGQGLPFPACTNCGSILPSSINVLTGKR